MAASAQTRGFQFRLRSLLLVVTAYSVWLGVQAGSLSGNEVAQGELWGWLCVCLGWSGLAAGLAWLARRQGRTAVGWFIASLLFNPLVAWLGLVIANELRDG